MEMTPETTLDCILLHKGQIVMLSKSHVTVGKYSITQLPWE